MDNDIVPGLLELIKKEFDKKALSSQKLKKAIELLKSRNATYLDANEFSVEVGTILADVLGENITAEILPDGKMHYNIADRILNPTMTKNYELISSYAEDVQIILNENANIGLIALKPEINQNRIDGIVSKISKESDFDKVKWLLNEPIKNFSQSIIDDIIRMNVKFQYEKGLRPKIIRKASGYCCDWCQKVIGVFDYPDDVPDDVYKRHRYCRCTVEYDPRDGKRQNVHTKEWRNTTRRDKIKEKDSKSNLVLVQSGAKNYYRDTTFDFLLSKEEKLQRIHAYLQYDAIKNSDNELAKRKIYSNLGKIKSMKDFSKEDVDIAFDHVFNDLHELEKGLSLFAPEYDMAQSWTRLISGDKIEYHDLVLLRHERIEHDYMYIDGMNYNDAHDKTNLMFNYKELADEYEERREANGNV